VPGLRSVPAMSRVIPIHRQIEKLREEVITHGLDRKPEKHVPDQFLIYARYGWKLGSYEDTPIDAMVKSVARKAGIPEE
jgi:hypothetical protein